MNLRGCSQGPPGFLLAIFEAAVPVVVVEIDWDLVVEVDWDLEIDWDLAESFEVVVFDDQL